MATKNILLVDNEKIFLTGLAEALGTSCAGDLCILTGENGKKALEILKSTPIDLVVTDLKMPVMDGFELLSHMKRRYPTIPVIVMSAFIDPGVERRLTDLGVSHYFQKPFDLESLEKGIQGSLGYPYFPSSGQKK